MKVCTLVLSFFFSHVSTETLYVALYNGNISTLSLTNYADITTSANNLAKNGYFAGSAPETKYELTQVSSTKTTAQNPAWLTLNTQNNVLYLLDGTTTGNGTISSYRASPSGVTLLDSVECLIDGAHAGFYLNGIRLAVAHYTSSALQTYEVTSNGNMTPLQRFTYTMSAPGPVASRQSAPHPHMAFADPTGQYIIVNDLGADLVRVYAVNQTSGELSERESLVAAPGSGPRHGVFSRSPISVAGVNGTTQYVYYLDAEIAGTVTAYGVNYLPDQGGLQFDLIKEYTTLAPGVAMPPIGKGISGEIGLSRDGDFLVISNRRDASFNGTIQQYPPNGTSDSINTYRVRQDLGGVLDFVQTVPAGGATPRTYAMNAAENLVAVALEFSDKITILKRDRNTGMILEQVAEINVSGDPWAILWDE
ncbi:hypothetical protein PFICI_02457 [Pestalotiopsis fici W106-1]|uniref:6-phosphogluconolactonase n=1 Tax=Pestalotiopsis fici (strain W106-1 / CGMCC3.15140) TaxID=1229662 RepID=W3XG81_PESFW|nr:uncharacterized protein PFICI_02457 [Pestalotiopsis fici W106-1]ETS84432.1 hypothetical protein PFICI_02457 [Pestalotiopsis fici W106-1]